jgi:signal transduction histidine kinase
MIPVRILFIEDSEDDVALQVRLLRQGGYEVVYERVDNAKLLTTSLDAKWDLIISDHSMPQFNGLEALRMVRSRGSDVPFIFVSGTIGEEAAVAALKVGAQDYLMKTNFHRLIPAVQRELRDAEERRQHRRLEEQVHQLRRFEAIGRLAGGVAHDFNNLIGAIMGWAEIGMEDAQHGSKEQDRFQKIRAQAERAAGLTRQLLAFARRQILQPRNTDLNELVREEMKLLRNVIGERIEIQLDLAEDLSAAWADAGQIEQVVMNLCLNARDAMPDGGRLSIQTRNTEVDEDFRRVHAFALPGSYVQLRVVDSGTGMDSQTLEHIFEPFFSTKEVGKGTGLGLATVYGIIKQHKGFITVESNPGEGASFQVYLPAGGGIARVEQHSPSSNESSRGHETILVAEDNEALRDVAKAFLEGLGYNVILALDGEAAVHIYEQARDSIDLVFLDVIMPGLNGSDAYVRMAAITPGLPVIFTTGYAAESDLIVARALDEAAILQKPYSFEQLARKLRETLDAGRSRRPQDV